MMSMIAESSARRLDDARVPASRCVPAPHRLLPRFPGLRPGNPAEQVAALVAIRKDRQEGRTLAHTRFRTTRLLQYFFFPVTVFRLTMLRRCRMAVSRNCLAIWLKSCWAAMYSTRLMSPCPTARGLVAHLLGGRDHIPGQLGHLATGHFIFLNGLFHVDQRLTLDVRELDLRLAHIEDAR